MPHLDESTLSAYLKGTLPREREAEVDEHLHGCPDCARLIDNWRILYKDMGRLAADREAPTPGEAPPPEPHDRGQHVLFPIGKTGETGTRRRPVWSGWLWIVGGLTAALLVVSVVALKMGVGRHQERNAHKVLDVLEGMRPDPVAPNRAPTRSVTPSTDSITADAIPDSTSSRAPWRPRADAALLVGDSVPEAPGTTMPEFERVSHVDATRRYGGPLRWIAGLPIDHYEVGPGGSVPGSSPATEVIRVVGRGDSGVVVLDQQRDPGIAGGVSLGVGDTLVTTGDNGVTVAMWRPSAVERVVLAAALSRDDLMALARRVR